MTTNATDPNAPAVTDRDVAPAAPNDPSQPAVARPDPRPEPAAPAPAEPEKVEYVDPRAAIAKRYQDRRAQHEQQFMGDHKPPFVEHGERTEATPQTDPAPVTDPAPAADAGFTLKVRGKDVKVASRDELLRLADVEPHEAADFTDDRLIRLAQKEMAANARLEEARSAQDVSRAAPAPVQQPVDPQQPQPEAKSLQDLLIDATNKMQLGTPEEAAEAWQAYNDRREAEFYAKRDAESRWNNEQVALQNDLRQFAENNADIASHPVAQDLLYPTASRMMAEDLLRLGISENDLRPALSNPELMSQAYRHARMQGLAVRSNAEILAASAARVREALRMPAQPGPGQQQPAAVTQRIEEKRQLQAQPTRTGHPISEPSPQMDIDASRKAAIQKTIDSRRAPNVPNGAFG